jgi:hypothetical protein
MEPTHRPPASTQVASSVPPIDHTVFVVEERPGVSAAALPKHSASTPPPAPGATAPRTTARFARALAEARSWVSATPAPGELSVHETSVASAGEPAFTPNEVVVRQDAAAAPVAPLQELQVSIGKIEVVIEDAAPGTVVPAPRMQTPASQPPAERGIRPLWRYHLRG